MDHALRTLSTDRGDAGRRLDLVLRRHLGDVGKATRTRLQTWIQEGRVSVNERVVRRVSARVAPGDVVHVRLPADAVPQVMQAEDLDLDILYEDEHLLAINKPAGRVVHPTYGHGAGTMMNALLWHARAWTEGQRPSLVGRLDKQTSGILAVAKTRAVHAALQAAMRSSDCAKHYLAVVYGRVPDVHGDIDVPLGRDPRDRRRVVTTGADGARSLTRFERLDSVDGRGASLALLQCRLVTGRMHQIRVHLAARGWPIVGDAKYGEPRWTHVADTRLAEALRVFPRQALHAWRLALPHPITLARLQIEAPLPQDLRDLLTATHLKTPVAR